ncbi:MAG: cupin domain-containing protein [Candidatus Nanopelagicales bacterium]
MNLLGDLPAATTAAEVTHVLAESANCRIERIVSHGQTTDWYDQDEHEWVAVLSGSARLEWADASQTVLRAGDWVTIPAHRGHRVSWTSPDEPTVWLAVFWAS